MTDGWLSRPRAGEPARPVIIRGHGEDRRRGDEERPGVSGPSSGAHPLRLRLVIIPPGTRGEPHFHVDGETAVYLVSGHADLWHGPGLACRSTVHAGDVMYIPPGMPHLAVNRGEVTTIAAIAHVNPPVRPGAVVVELPRHLADLLSYPVASDE